MKTKGKTIKTDKKIRYFPFIKSPPDVSLISRV
jgi:hypothetical protein